jgi:hypothetical protein
MEYDAMRVGQPPGRRTDPGEGGGRALAIRLAVTSHLGIARALLVRDPDRHAIRLAQSGSR